MMRRCVWRMAQLVRVGPPSRAVTSTPLLLAPPLLVAPSGQAADHVGFPAVIKPIHGAASLGVLRVDSKEALAAAYDKVRGPRERSCVCCT